jgi:hypothetical protein
MTKEGEERKSWVIKLLEKVRVSYEWTNKSRKHVELAIWCGFKNAYDVNELVHTKICKTLQGHV